MASDENNNLDKTSIVPSETFKLRIAQAGKAPPSLVLLVGPANAIGRQWPIEDSNYVIGRAISANISVDDGSVSKSHAKLQLNEGEVSIIDLESTNKTVINNGVKLEPLNPYILRDNDQIKLGNIIFKFLAQGNIESVSAAESYDKANIDALTQIHNKGALEHKGIEYFKKSQMLDIHFSIITFDIDFFKKVNDTYGHSAGDYILQETSALVRDQLIRGDDFFARSGGEEFTLLLLGEAVEQTTKMAERIRLTIEQKKFEFNGTSIPITVSLGVSTKSNMDHSWLDIFDRADEALYKSKKGGRNRVSTGLA